ncbi:MAG: UDP-N-acetylmuramate--L-alanine ligase [Candidatus Auribacterota bacterium]|nr:UDP-N-acetylmuramate--L-alanine ligase [Candidatus Auribacterota bacterium]
MKVGNKNKLFGGQQPEHIHFIGIGGAGMNVLARIMLNLGFKVSGSDLRRSDITEDLSARGAVIFSGHKREQSSRADLVVYSSAVKKDNPELAGARRRGVTILHRSELLAGLMNLKRGIAVAGSHGKTSTSAMIAWILLESGREPALALGGKIIGLEDHPGWGRGENLVAEADESDGSLSRFFPAAEVITGLDLDHVDYYAGWDQLVETFRKFVGHLPEEGRLVIEAGTRDLNRISQEAPEVVTYGLSPSAQVRGIRLSFDRQGSRFIVEDNGEEMGEIVLARPGSCNVINALGATALSLREGVSFPEIARALNTFPGVRRRLEIKSLNPIMIVEDYAHHPAEVTAALEAIRGTGPRKLWCVFQPHRYSRTRHFFRELAESLRGADRIILTELYPAFENPLPGVSSSLILNELKEMNRPDALLMEYSSVQSYLQKEMRAGDAVIVMGAGDIGRLADELMEELITI